MNTDKQFLAWYSPLAYRHLPWSAPENELREAFDAGYQAGAAKPKATSKHAARAAEIYKLYPRKIARKPAIRAIIKALEKEDVVLLLTAVQAYADAVAQWSPGARYTRDGVDTVPHASTWFNQERWLDDRREWKKEGGAIPSRFSIAH